MNKLKKVEKGTYYHDQEIKRQLRILAATSGKSQSELVDEALQLLFKSPGGKA